MYKEAEGILGNPVLNYLPSKLEDLIASALFKPGGHETRDWFKSRMNYADLFEQSGRLVPHQISKWLGLVSKEVRDKAVGEAVGDKLMHLRQVSDEGDSFKKFIGSGIDKKLLTNMTTSLRNSTGAAHFADSYGGSSGRGMSYSRMLGHALQGGGLTAALLTLPYVSKRYKQHVSLGKDEKKKDKLEKKASGKGLFEQLAGVMEANKATDLVSSENVYSPWKRNALALPLAVLAAMGAYKGTKHGILNLTDKVSDRQMDKRDMELRRRLSRLMVSDGISKEAGLIPEPDRHGTSLSKVLLPVILAMWAGMIPPFYSFGKKLGKDTSENAQYDKLVNALSAFEKDTPKSTKFRVGDEGDILEQRPGSFLGSRTVTLPVANKNRASAALSEIF